MSWLSRIWRPSSPGSVQEPPEEPSAPRVIRTAPGVEAIFSGIGKDENHGVLDLGPAVEANLHFYSRFARWVRFGSLLKDPPRGEAWTEALERLPPLPQGPYTVVMAWNLLDRLPPEDRPALIERIVELTGQGSRLYVLVAEGEEDRGRPYRFSIQEDGMVSQEFVGSPGQLQPQLLPAHVERVLSPFRVAHAFTLRGGFREYVAHWKGADPRADTWWTR